MIRAAVAHAMPQTRVQPATTADATWPRRACPECLTPLVRPRAGQLFCCTRHKAVFNQRMRQRGAVVGPLYAAARTTRDGTRGNDAQRAIGKRAHADAALAHQRWKEEDERERRMPVLEYIALRYRHGFVEVVR